MNRGKRLTLNQWEKIPVGTILEFDCGSVDPPPQVVITLGPGQPVGDIAFHFPVFALTGHSPTWRIHSGNINLITILAYMDPQKNSSTRF